MITVSAATCGTDNLHCTVLHQLLCSPESVKCLLQVLKKPTGIFFQCIVVLESVIVVLERSSKYLVKSYTQGEASEFIRT